MTWLTVWVPDELAKRAWEASLDISALTQAAISAELRRHATAAWLETLPTPGGFSHDTALDALEAARDEFGQGSQTQRGCAGPPDC